MSDEMPADEEDVYTEPKDKDEVLYPLSRRDQYWFVGVSLLAALVWAGILYWALSYLGR